MNRMNGNCNMRDNFIYQLDRRNDKEAKKVTDREKVIKGLECCKDIHTAGPGYAQGCTLCPYGETPSDGAGGYACFRAMVKDAIVLLKAQKQAAEQLRGGYIENLITTAIALKLKDVPLPTDAALEMVRLLKAQEPREPHYTKLEYIVNGMPVAINHPECPRCYDNGLVLWDAEIEKGASYCKRCGQAVKWE